MIRMAHKTLKSLHRKAFQDLVSNVEGQNRTEAIRALLAPPKSKGIGEPAAAGLEVDESIRSWLGKLKLLNGVPFHYLVPDERMLPPESIRFFYLDINWVNALVDGAYNIGRYAAKTDTVPKMVDRAAKKSIEQTATSSAGNIRLEKLLRPTSKAIESWDKISGFLLRSQVVKNWKSLEATAYAKGQEPGTEQSQTLKMIRFERLSPTVVIGLFIGDIYQLDLHEPPEALHFGFKATNNGFAKPIRNQDQDDTAEENKLKLEEKELKDTFRTGEKKVVNFFKLSQKLYEKSKPRPVDYGEGLKKAMKMEKALSPLLASDFAFQMIQGVGNVSFIKKES